MPAAGVDAAVAAADAAARTAGVRIRELSGLDELGDVYRLYDAIWRLESFNSAKFNPRNSSSWAKLEAHVDDQFIWIPWNWVTTKQFLTNLPLLTMTSVDWAKPAHISLHEVVRDHPISTLPFPQPEGVAVSRHRASHELSGFWSRTRQSFRWHSYISF